jgi:hypothetical protein
MHQSWLQLQPLQELVLAKLLMNVPKKIFKLMEEWDSLGNLIATFITEDVVN